jgi:hypothetical protein
MFSSHGPQHSPAQPLPTSKSWSCTRLGDHPTDDGRDGPSRFVGPVTFHRLTTTSAQTQRKRCGRRAAGGCEEEGRGYLQKILDSDVGFAVAQE